MTSAASAAAAASFYLGLLNKDEAGLAQAWFSLDVLSRYRDQGFELIRSETVGRLKGGGWTLDFGIVDEAGVLHASLRDLIAALPQGEREHWSAHVVTPAASANFLRMQLHPRSCIDDGEPRRW